MKITRTSFLSGISRTRDLDITEEQLEDYRAGEVAQRAFPNLTPGEREFFMTGATDEEWDERFKEDDVE